MTRWAQGVVLLIGVAYLALGIAGFVRYGGGDIGPDDDRTVWVFGVSVLFNIVHTGVGLLGVLASRAPATTRVYGWVIFFGFAGLAAYSIAATAVNGAGDIANATVANAWLYGCTSAIGLALSLVEVGRLTSSAGPTRG